MQCKSTVFSFTVIMSKINTQELTITCLSNFHEKNPQIHWLHTHTHTHTHPHTHTHTHTHTHPHTHTEKSSQNNNHSAFKVGHHSLKNIHFPASFLFVFLIFWLWNRGRVRLRSHLLQVQTFLGSGRGLDPLAKCAARWFSSWRAFITAEASALESSFDSLLRRPADNVGRALD